MLNSRPVTRRGWLLFAAMCLLWGVPYLLIKVAVAEVSVPVVVFCPTALGALVLLLDEPLAVTCVLATRSPAAPANDQLCWEPGCATLEAEPGADPEADWGPNPTTRPEEGVR